MGKICKGFTLIELLVVIVIIALIATIAVVLYSLAAARGRDATREENIKSIENALNLYINQKQTYPLCPTEEVVDGSTDCLSSALLSEDVIVTVPLDPLHRNTGVCGEAQFFVYCYRSVDGLSYAIRYHLETDSVHGKSAGWQTIMP